VKAERGSDGVPGPEPGSRQEGGIASDRIVNLLYKCRSVRVSSWDSTEVRPSIRRRLYGEQIRAVGVR
jgi:hypothetical protein